MARLPRFFEKLIASSGAVTSAQLVTANLQYMANQGRPQIDFIQSIINDWKNSDEYTTMIDAEAYYKNKNKSMLERKRETIGFTGAKEEDPLLTNTKTPHPFFRELVDSKNAFLLSQPYSLKVDDGNEAYQKLLEEELGEKRLNLSNRLFKLGTRSLRGGKAWLQYYYDEKGQGQIRVNNSWEIIPFWKDEEKTVLDAAIRFYEMDVYEKDRKFTITKIEYHDGTGVWYYVIDDKGTRPDPFEYGEQLPYAKPHFIAQRVNEETGEVEDVGMVFDRVPFICFRYADDELSLLELVRYLIDAYDFGVSDIANSIGDIAFAIYVVKNFDGDNLGAFREGLKKYKAAAVTDEGDVSTLNPTTQMSMLDSHLDRLKRDIFASGRGVYEEGRLGAQVSGKALDRLFSKMTLDANLMSMQFLQGIKDLLWFVNNDFANRGLGDFHDVKVEILFNKDMPVNEPEIIRSLRDSRGMISDETIVANHPLVTNVEEELKRMKKEKEDDMLFAQEYGFGQPIEPTEPPEPGGGNEE